MTATNIVCAKRHRRVHVVTDAAGYDDRGVVIAIGTKVFPVAHWPGVVTGRGTAIAIPVLGQELSWRFPTFDDVIEGIEAVLPPIVAQYRIGGAVELIIAGWSSLKNEPQAFVIETSDDLPVGVSEIEKADIERRGAILPAAWQLQRLPEATEGPCIAYGSGLEPGQSWQGIDPSHGDVKMVARLRTLINLQRLQQHDGRYLVGGFAEHTVVTPDGISQRILDRWPEDQVGFPILPRGRQ